MTALPLTLYVHLPWCVRKCPYCDFNSHQSPDSLPETRYLDALKADLDFALQTAGTPRPLEAIFFGGGTPSLFSAAGLGGFLEHVAKRLSLADDIEITMEANPGTVEHDSFRNYRSAGINRVSLGVQSFDDTALQVLGRIHDSGAAHAALEELHAAGMDNFNIDLMHGLPHQTIEGAIADVEQALAANPAHISHYELTLEPNTLFAARPPQGLPDQDLQSEIFDACAARMKGAGFERYEVSAWAKPGRQSRHNLNYWTFGDYLGIGAGAHGKMTLADITVRESRQRHPERYLDTAGRTDMVQDRRELSREDKVFEFVLNASRLTQGIEDGLFESRTGLPASDLDAGLSEAESAGWLVRDGNSGWILTPAGLNWLNDLQALFLPGARQQDALLFETSLSCPYCGEWIAAKADTTVGPHTFIEDCPVCCQPIEFGLEASESGGWKLRTGRDDEA